LDNVLLRELKAKDRVLELHSELELKRRPHTFYALLPSILIKPKEIKLLPKRAIRSGNILPYLRKMEYGGRVV